MNTATHQSTEEDRKVLAEFGQRQAAIDTLHFQWLLGGDPVVFRAEFAEENGDLIFHFYPGEGRDPLGFFWSVQFPQVLNSIAPVHFEASFPRLRAAYTKEMKSWWVRADGFEHILNKELFAQRFCDKLLAALATSST